MKTAITFFPLMIAFIISMAGGANAQGRGHHKGSERNAAGHHDRRGHHKDHWKHDRKHDRHHGHDYHHSDRREVRHVVHHHDRYCNHAPVVVRHYHTRPRYIYYRDYDVYYDIHRSVYISYSGRSWTVSARLPLELHHVDIRRTVRMEVDYDHDDFPLYLERGRPAYRRIYAGS